MSKLGKPRLKRMRRVGSDLGLMSGMRPLDSKGKISTRPGMHGAKRTRLSNYAINLRSKQYVRYTYSILDKQLLRYHLEAVRKMKALRKQGKEADYRLFMMLESRLEVVVCRMGFAVTIEAARQLVGHGKVFVDGKKQSKRGFQVRPGASIEVRVEEKQSATVKASLDLLSKHSKLSNWVSIESDPSLSKKVNPESKAEITLYVFRGTFVREPNREELPPGLVERESDVIQLYSK